MSHPLSGDLHIYASTIPEPGRDNYIWKSTHTGPNEISFDGNHANYTRGPIYISVYGVWRTNFKILSWVSNEGNILLDDQEPQLAVVEKGEYTHFTYTLTSNKTFSISASNLAGSCYVYIDTIGRPSRFSKKWFFYNSATNVLTIQSTDPNFIVGTYYISVWSDYYRSTFQLGVTLQDGVEVLSEGMPQAKEVLLNEYQYLSYHLSSYNDILIEARPRTSGNMPYLCISATVKKPRKEDGSCTWWTIPVDNLASQVIRMTDRFYRNGTYYIGVYGSNQDIAQRRVRFIVTAATRLKSTLLQDGLPMTLSQPGSSYQFYRFFYASPDIIMTIEAMESLGKVEIYVTNDPTNMNPTKDEFRWRSFSFGSIARVNLRYTTVGWYYIGVLSIGNANYTLQASTSQIAVNLLLSTTYYYWWGLPNGLYKHFILPLPQGASEDLTINTNYLTGDGYIYVGDQPFPNATNYMWRSLNTHGVVIPAREFIVYNFSTLYISILSSSPTNGVFTILPFYSGSLVPLLMSSPMNGFVEDRKYRYYVYSANKEGRVRFTMTSLNNLEAMIFASSEPNPLETNYRWRSNYFGPKSIILEDVQIGDVIYLSVQGRSGSNATDYQLRVSLDFEILLDGDKAIHDDVEEGKYRIYQLWIPPWASKFTVSTTLVNGFSEMYLSANDTIPNRENFTLSNWNWPGNVITLRKKDPLWQTGLWTIAVFGQQSSDYFISSMTEFGHLSVDIPVTGYATQESEFYWGSINSLENVFFNLKVYDSGCVNIYISQTVEKPSVGTARWTARSDPLFSQHISVPLNKEELDPTIPYIYVGVRACYFDGYHHQYELTMSQDDVPMYISTEVPNLFFGMQRNVIKKPWFLVNHFSYSRGFTFTLDSCGPPIPGAVVLATTDDTVGYPINSTAAQYRSVSTSPYSLSIQSIDNFRDKRVLLSLDQPMPSLPNVFELYASTGPNTRPQITGLVVTFVRHVTQGEVLPHIDEYNVDISPILSNSYPLTIEIVWSRPGAGNPVTVCGLHRNKASTIQTFVLSQRMDDKITSTIRYDNQIDWDLNIIVTDDFGRQSSAPVARTIVSHHGQIVIRSFFEFSFGGILILIGSVTIVFYLLIGMILKKYIYNAKGLDLIPNIDFWKQIPDFFMEGVRMTGRCLKCQRKVHLEKVDSLSQEPVDDVHEKLIEGDAEMTRDENQKQGDVSDKAEQVIPEVVHVEGV